jgi:hypothetical protein
MLAIIMIGIPINRNAMPCRISFSFFIRNAPWGA